MPNIGVSVTTLKKIFLITILTNTVLLSSLGGTDLWSKRYNRSETFSKKTSIVLEILEQNDSSLYSILSDALRLDIIPNLHNEKSLNDESEYIDLARTIVYNLGKLGIKETAGDMYELYQNHSNPYLKAQCLTALGTMGMDEYTENILYILEQQNSRSIEGFSASVDQYNESIIAYAAIYALDQLGAESAYNTILKSTLSWYPDRVTEFALEVLERLTDEPTKQLIQLLESGDLKSKEAAINQIYICKDSDSNKIMGARKALEQGFISREDTADEQTILLEIRKKALLTYIKYGSDENDIYYISESLKNGDDLAEKIFAIQALRFNKSGESTLTLSKILMDYNFKNFNSFGLTIEEQDVVRELMDTLGLKGDINGYDALLESTLSNYTPGIVKHANKALEMLDQIN